MDILNFVSVYFLQLGTSIFIIVLECVNGFLLAPFLLLKSCMQKDKKFNSVLITGASKGIGEALAIKYAAQGMHLFLSARSADKLENVKKLCETKGASVHVFPVDVTDKEKMKDVIKQADKIKPLDLVIANAGVADFFKPNLVVDVNCNGLVNTVLPALDVMKTRKKGHLCLLGSVSSFFGGWKSEDCYGSTKMFVLGYGRALRDRMRKHKIGVTVVCPGLILTDMTADGIENGMSKSFVGKLLVKAGLTPKQCAEHIAYANRRNLQDYQFPWMYNFVGAIFRSGWRRGSIAC